MKNRYNTLIVAMLIGGVALPLGMTFVAADPAALVTLSYNAGTEELNVEIMHPVGDPDAHYIATITITVNSVLNATYIYDSQPNDTQFSYNYTISLVDGDVVSVTATCVEGGDGIGTLTIGETTDPTDDPTDEPSIPGYSMVAMIMSLLTLGMLIRNISRLRRR